MEFKEAYKQKLLEVFDFTVKFLDDHNLQWWAAYGTGIGAVRHKGLIPWDDDIDLYMLRKDYDILLSLRDEIQNHGYDILDAHNGLNSMFFLKISDQHTTLVSEAEEPLDVGVYIDVFPLDYCDGDVVQFDKDYMEIKKWLGFYKYMYFKISLTDIIASVKKKDGRTAQFIYSMIAPKFMKDFSKRKIEKIEKKISNHGKDSFLGSYFGAYRKKEVYNAEWFDGYKELTYEGRSIRLPLHYDEYLRHIYGDYMTPPAVIPESTHCQYYVNLKEKISLDEVKERISKGITKEF